MKKSNFFILIMALMVISHLEFFPANEANAIVTDRAFVPTEEIVPSTWVKTCSGTNTICTDEQDGSLVYHPYNAYPKYDPFTTTFSGQEVSDIGVISSAVLSFHWYSYGTASMKVQIEVNGVVETVHTSFNPSGPPSVTNTFNLDVSEWTAQTIEDLKVTLIPVTVGNTFGVDHIKLTVDFVSTIHKFVPTQELVPATWVKTCSGSNIICTDAQDGSLVYHPYSNRDNNPFITTFTGQDISSITTVSSAHLEFKWYSFGTASVKVETEINGNYEVLDSSFNPAGPPAVIDSFNLDVTNWDSSTIENFKVKLTPAVVGNTLGVDSIELIVDSPSPNPNPEFSLNWKKNTDPWNNLYSGKSYDGNQYLFSVTGTLGLNGDEIVLYKSFTKDIDNFDINTANWGSPITSTQNFPVDYVFSTSDPSGLYAFKVEIKDTSGQILASETSLKGRVWINGAQDVTVTSWPSSSPGTISFSINGDWPMTVASYTVLYTLNGGTSVSVTTGTMSTTSGTTKSLTNLDFGNVWGKTVGTYNIKVELKESTSNSDYSYAISQVTASKNTDIDTVSLNSYFYDDSKWNTYAGIITGPTPSLVYVDCSDIDSMSLNFKVVDHDSIFGYTGTCYAKSNWIHIPKGESVSVKVLASLSAFWSGLTWDGAGLEIYTKYYESIDENGNGVSLLNTDITSPWSKGYEALGGSVSDFSIDETTASYLNTQKDTYLIITIKLYGSPTDYVPWNPEVFDMLDNSRGLFINGIEILV